MKLTIFLIILTGIISFAHSQEIITPDVPSTLQKTFKKSYPAITAAEWKQSGDSYTAVYYENQLERSITYNASGKVQLKEEQVTLAQLPTGILKYINENHADGTIRKARKITASGGKYSYSVSIKGMELLFDANGNYLRSSLDQ
jgi:hypothetical protein